MTEVGGHPLCGRQGEGVWGTKGGTRNWSYVAVRVKKMAFRRRGASVNLVCAIPWDVSGKTRELN